MEGTVKAASMTQPKLAQSKTKTSQPEGTARADEFSQLLQDKTELTEQPRTKAEDRVKPQKGTTPKKAQDTKGSKQPVNNQEKESEGEEKVSPESGSNPDALGMALQQQALLQAAAQLTGNMVELQETQQQTESAPALFVSEEAGSQEILLAEEIFPDAAQTNVGLAFTAPTAEKGQDLPVLTAEAKAEIPAAVQPESQKAAELQPKETLPQPEEAKSSSAGQAISQQETTAAQATQQPAAAAEAGQKETSKISTSRQEEHPSEKLSAANEESQPKDTNQVQAIPAGRQQQKADTQPDAGKKQAEYSGPGERRSLDTARTEEEPSLSYRVENLQSFRLSDQNYAFQSMNRTAGEIPMRTTPQELPIDLGKTLANRMTQQNQTLTIELEPASLGKLTIRLTYEAGQAAVSIMASNPKTLELLSQRAGEIGAILQEKTGQETLIYTQQPQPQQQYQEENSRRGNQQNQEEQSEKENRQEEDQHQTESFAQQLRLGLV